MEQNQYNQEKQQEIGKQPISASGPGSNRSSENMQVAVRLRPMTERERKKGNKRIVEIEQNTVQLMNPKHTHDRYKKFTFDYSYWSYDGFRKNEKGIWVPDLSHPNGINYVDQERVFRDLGQFLLDNAVKGYNSALLAYGQTGSGKSYTVSGYGANEGILPRFARAIYVELDKCTIQDGKQQQENIKTSSNTKDNNINNLNQRYEVYFSMIEIYNEVVRDLLPKSSGYHQMTAADTDDSAGNTSAGGGRQITSSSNSSVTGRGLKIREHPARGFFVENLSSYVCRNKEEIERRIEEGQLNKSIAATRMNETSSRGHTIYEFRIKQYKSRSGGGGGVAKTTSGTGNDTSTTASADKQQKSCSSSSTANKDDIVIESVVQLVDLAGSERTTIHTPEEIQAPGGGGAPVGGGGPSNSDHHRSNNYSSVRGPKSTSSSTSGSTISRSSSMRPNRASGGGSGGAGAPNQAKTTSHQQRFKESVSINQSLSALGNCIQVMSQNSQLHQKGGAPVKIPYRDSALTKLLNRCCLSGNSKVVIIATLSPADNYFDETLSTLRFADRAKQIRTHAVINQTTRRASLADGGASLLMQSASSLLKNHQTTNRRLRQINESGSGNVGVGSSGSGGSGSHIADALATPTRKRTATKRTSGSIPVSNNSRANSRSNPSLAKKLVGQAAGSNRRVATKQTGLSPETTTNEGMRKSRSEHRLASNGDMMENLNEFDDEEEEYITDLGDLRDGFISPESDDSMAALADEDLSPDEKIEILNRMLNNSGPGERILAIQEETGEPGATDSNRQPANDPSNKRSGAQARRLQSNKLRAEIKQVSLISSTLKRTNPYITNLNADEQLSGVLSYMIKQGETIIGKNGNCDVVIHGTEIRGRHAKIIRSDEGIFLESIFDNNENNDSSSSSNKQPNAVNIRLNGYPVLERVKLNHCDRILFGTNSYFVVANLSDKNKSEKSSNIQQANSDTNQSAGADRVGDLDLVTYEMAKNEVLRGVMREDQNKNVIKEINDYTHRPGTGKLKKNQPPTTSNGDQNREQKSRPSGDQQGSRNQSKESQSIHKLTRSMTIQDNDEDLIRADEVKLTNQPNMILNEEESSLAGDDDQDEIYRKQLMEDTYDFVIPVTEVNAIATEMGIKVTYELKIVNGEEQLPHQTFGQYYGSNISDVFSSSSIGDENEHQQQQQGSTGNTNKTNNDRTGSNSQTNTNSAGKNSNSSGFSEAGAGTANHQNLNNNDDSSSQQPSDVTYLNELHELDIPPALYIKVHLTEFDFDFYWEKEKFQNRRYKMLELYGPWSLGGKSALVEYLIEQSRIQGNYLIDPFIDDPSTNLVLIGHSQITLKPIAHQTDKRQVYDIINFNDETMGTLKVEAIPCHINDNNSSNDTGTNRAPSSGNDIFTPFSEQDSATMLVEDTKQLLGKKIAFMLRIVSCNDLIAKYSNIFCQYSLGSRHPIVRTRAFYHGELETITTRPANDINTSVDEAPEVERFTQINFDHSHYICFESVTADLLEFLEFGFLTIQVVGQHRIPKHLIGQSPTMITTIISSINKYKSKIEQASNYGSANYSNGDYFLGSAHSSNSYKMLDGQTGNNQQMQANSSSLASNSAKTINMFDQAGAEYDENGMLINGVPQENIIDMILTKRKLDRAENQLHYLKRTVNIAEHYNKKHIPIKVVKKLLNSYGQEVDGKSIDENPTEATVTNRQEVAANKKSGCNIQ